MNAFLWFHIDEYNNIVKKVSILNMYIKNYE